MTPAWTRTLHPTGIPTPFRNDSALVHCALNFRIAGNQPGDDGKRYALLAGSRARGLLPEAPFSVPRGFDGDQQTEGLYLLTT